MYLISVLNDVIHLKYIHKPRGFFLAVNTSLKDNLEDRCALNIFKFFRNKDATMNPQYHLFYIPVLSK